MAAHIFFACWLNYKQEIIGETVCCVRQGFNKNLADKYLSTAINHACRALSCTPDTAP